MPRNLEFPMSSWLLKDKRGFMNKFFFFWPFMIIWAMVMISSHMVVFAGVPLALLAGYTLQWVALQVMEYAPSDMRHIHKTVRFSMVDQNRTDRLALAGWHICWDSFLGRA